MNIEHKKILYKIFQAVLLLVIFDWSFGQMARYLFNCQKSGKYYRISYTLEHTNQDILVFGSSHANRHYNPDIIEKISGYTCYNTGVDGQGIVFTTALKNIILKRHVPKLIILNIDIDWLNKNAVMYDRLEDLAPFFSKFRKEISTVFDLKSRFDKYKYISNVYQFNSTIVHILKYFFLRQHDINGYVPLNEIMVRNHMDITDNYNHFELDDNFILYFDSFIKNSIIRGSKIIIFISPIFNKVNLNDCLSFKKMKSIAKKYNCNLFDYHDDQRFQNKINLFYNKTHLNNNGARLYSNIVAKHILDLNP
jgi:hypothetical protein